MPRPTASHPSGIDPLPRLSARDRRLLIELTSLPTAAGREWVVQTALDAWIARHGSALRSRRDEVGNLLVTPSRTRRPSLLITAHLDHPAFVVRRRRSPRELELEFRGGVHDPYFKGAAIEVFGDDGVPHRARIASLDPKAKPFKRVIATMTGGGAGPGPGAIARWALPPAEIRDGMLRTHACDDLAAVAAALITFERLLAQGDADDAGLLFTVAEEVGFLGAIHASNSGIIPRGARLLCLENSRSFPHDSPIGAGAILRVGDRLSVFSPELTNALTQLYQRTAARSPRFRFQRKLMAGGACEATAFAALGHESTCLCLPLGNYHNMAAIDEVLAGARPARLEREFVAISDVQSLVAMLILAVRHLSGSRARGDFSPLMRSLWKERARPVLGGRRIGTAV